MKKETSEKKNLNLEEGMPSDHPCVTTNSREEALSTALNLAISFLEKERGKYRTSPHYLEKVILELKGVVRDESP